MRKTLQKLWMLGAAAAFASSAALCGCDNDVDSPEDAVEEAGDALDEAGDEIDDAFN